MHATRGIVTIGAAAGADTGAETGVDGDTDGDGGTDVMASNVVAVQSLTRNGGILVRIKSLCSNRAPDSKSFIPLFSIKKTPPGSWARCG